jgi:hypothetical protein
VRYAGVGHRWRRRHNITVDTPMQSGYIPPIWLR